MGLDMFLFKRTEGEDSLREVAYWRKKNAIHNWFVMHVQGGEDECRPFDVPQHRLAELLNLCRVVKERPDLAEQCLPTRGGFFFGPTEYDEWYVNGLDETIEQLESLLDNATPDDRFVYQSSW